MNREITILIHLQKNVEKQFGKQISSSTDCDQLARLLTRDFNSNVSSQTLRRFFGLIKSESKSSHFTLDILSKFCGFKDFKSFSYSYRNTELELFFADAGNIDQNYWEKSEQLCKQITDSPELLVNTHHRLMSFPMARKYFIEHHPLRDMIGTVYSQYFLAYLKFNHSNQAKIFAYGFLFNSAFLLQNTELMELYYKKVKETELTDEVHVIPAGLKYGVQLLYADITRNEYLFRKYFAEMKKVRIQYIEDSEKSVCSFESTVLESLIFTNRTKEIKFLINNNSFQKNDDRTFIPLERKQTHDEVWNILCATAYQKIGDHKNAALYLNTIKLENLGIGWRKYYSILYYFAKLNCKDRNEQSSIILKLKTLIDENYFCYYNNSLNEYSELADKKKKQFDDIREFEPLLVG